MSLKMKEKEYVINVAQLVFFLCKDFIIKHLKWV
jgi:hypothetical protein